MKTTYGQQPSTMPKGFFKAIEFPVLARLDTTTGDHRRLASEGANTRDLPQTIRFANKASYGHEGAIVSGALFEVTVDPENNLVSGKGFLLDDENGRTHARLVATGAMRGNSADLAEVEARYVENFDNDEWYIEFMKWSLAATTGVATPAFADAHAIIPDGMTDEELTASMLVDPMEPLTCEFDEFYIRTEFDNKTSELAASGATVVPFDDFFIPEADELTKVIVDAEGRVFGHLASWNSCHSGFNDRCVMVPRPRDGYASFNKPGPLTEKGHVQTGPIFAFGGHRSLLGAESVEKAYGGIENCWADVRVVEGRFGPWLSGRVRPGVSDEVLYAARASRLSGHWVNDELRAIVCVNVEGYDVKGDPTKSAISFTSDAENNYELVASLPGCLDVAEAEVGTQLTLTLNIPDGMSADDLVSRVRAAFFDEEEDADAVETTDTEASTDDEDEALLADLLAEEDDDS